LLPATAIDVIGSTVLGIALLRSRYEPRVTPWLLALVFPSMLVRHGCSRPTTIGAVLLLVLVWLLRREGEGSQADARVLVVYFANRQHGAGTKRVHETEHGRARAGTQDAA
jgi:hypothetical protein